MGVRDHRRLPRHGGPLMPMRRSTHHRSTVPPDPQPGGTGVPGAQRMPRTPATLRRNRTTPPQGGPSSLPPRTPACGGGNAIPGAGPILTRDGRASFRWPVLIAAALIAAGIVPAQGRACMDSARAVWSLWPSSHPTYTGHGRSKCWFPRGEAGAARRALAGQATPAAPTPLPRPRPSSAPPAEGIIVDVATVAPASFADRFSAAWGTR